MDHDFASAILTSRLVNNAYMVSGNQRSLPAHIYQAAIIAGIVIQVFHVQIAYGTLSISDIILRFSFKKTKKRLSRIF